MNEVVTVDARGLSCPEPAIMAREAVKDLTSGRVEVLVDSDVSRDNVRRVVEKAGWSVTAETLPRGEFRLVLTK